MQACGVRCQALAGVFGRGPLVAFMVGFPTSCSSCIERRSRGTRRPATQGQISTSALAPGRSVPIWEAEIDSPAVEHVQQESIPASSVYQCACKESSDLALRARIGLERLQNGEADRSLINLVSQVVIITGFITRAGHGELDIREIERVERDLGEVLAEADRSGVWDVPKSLIEGLTAVINEYDRQLCVSRMEIVVRASDYLGKLVGMVSAIPNETKAGYPALHCVHNHAQPCAR